MKPIISIIVPVYNVEKYLYKCIDSILNQTFTNFELILINDGSTDNSMKICEDFAKKDKRIVLVNKKNEGVSEARNTGIDIARGMFIGFVDSDDWIDKDMYNTLYKLIDKHEADIAMCNYYAYKDGKKYENNYYKYITFDKILKGDDIINKISTYDILSWNKLYKKEIIGELRFPKGKIHEDQLLTYKILHNANKVICINDYLYYYRSRANSITNINLNSKNLDVLDAMLERAKFCKKNKLIDGEYFSYIQFSFRLFSYYFDNFEDKKNAKYRLNLFKKEYCKIFKFIIKNENIEFNKKILMTLFYINPYLYKTSIYLISYKNKSINCIKSIINNKENKCESNSCS